jgi:glutaredoxin
VNAAFRAAILGLVLLVGEAPSTAQTRCTQIEMFSRADCPHCGRAREFLAELRAARSDLDIRIVDVGLDPAARERLRELAARHGIKPIGVPAFAICDAFLVGFDDATTTGQAILAALALPRERPATAVEVPWLGLIDAGHVGLPLFTVVLGLVDGLNPCATWVLLILLSVLVGIYDRRKLVAVAGVFVLVSGLVYFAFMAAWLNAFLWIGWSRGVQVVLGCLALGIGLLHAKDALGVRTLPSVRIPGAVRPHLYARIRAIAGARSLGPALFGAFVLALVVNVVELMCTAGLPALYTQVLTLHELRPGHYYGYLLLYNAAYIIDDGALMAASIITMRRFKLQETHGRWLKGLSGLVMLLLATLLLLKPGWLHT